MSAGMRTSKRKLGGVTVQESLCALYLNSRNLNLDSIHLGSRSKPSTLAIFSLDILIGSSNGREDGLTHSLIGDALPPQISRTNSVALSRACFVILKSTPRSNLSEDSVCSP